MKKIHKFTIISVLLIITAGCSSDSAERIRYDMEKLVYSAGKLAERINIQPELSTPSDSSEIESVFHSILDYYFENRSNPVLAEDKTALAEMDRMAYSIQMELAGFYVAQSRPDSVIAAYRRIGNEIPAGKYEIGGATLGLALSYRALRMFDSALAIYDRLLDDFYPPIDSLDRVNIDLAAIPIDKIKIGKSLGDAARLKAFERSALEYYGKLKTDFPDNPHLSRTGKIYTSRVYVMNERWDEAIEALQQIKDSVGDLDIRSAVLIANIYAAAKNDHSKAIELYRDILDREPDSSVIGPTMLRLGAALLIQKDYEEGRKVLAGLKKKFERHSGLVAAAQIRYAESFEEQGRWDRALSEMQWLMENHPYTEQAFEAAHNIPIHFEEVGDEKLAEIWNRRAIDFYEKAARIKQGRPIAVAAHSHMADIYRKLGQYDEAMEQLELIYSSVPNSKLGAKALYNAASLALNEMGDSVLAQGYLNRLVQTFGTTDSSQINQEEKLDLDIESIQ